VHARSACSIAAPPSSRLADIAETVGASMFHLCRCFRAGTGLTLHEYRTQLRLRGALERSSPATAISPISRSTAASAVTATSLRHSGARSRYAVTRA
jgi:methylphosphotriester-DNA--protein-cysteine methyltransferase